MEIGFRLVLVDRCLLYHLLRHRSQFNFDHRVFQKQVKLSLSLSFRNAKTIAVHTFILSLGFWNKFIPLK